MGGFLLLASFFIEIDWLTELPWWVCTAIGTFGILWMIRLLFSSEPMTNDALSVIGAALGSVIYLAVGLHKFKQRKTN